MTNREDEDFAIFLGLMSQTGFLYILRLTVNNKEITVDEIENAVNKHFEKEVSAKIIINGLENLGLIKKADSKKTYSSTFIGEKAFSLLTQIKEIIWYHQHDSKQIFLIKFCIGFW